MCYFRTVFSMPNTSAVSIVVNNASHRIQISWKYLSLERSWPSIACFKLGYFGYINPSHRAAATQRWGTGELRLYILQKWTETSVHVIMEITLSLWTSRTCMRQSVAYRGGVGVLNHPPPKFRRSSKIVPNLNPIF